MKELNLPLIGKYNDALKQEAMGAIEWWVRNTKEGKNWLASMAAEIGVPIQTAFPFMEPGDAHTHDEGTIYCNVCHDNGEESNNGEASNQHQEHPDGR